MSRSEARLAAAAGLVLLLAGCAVPVRVEGAPSPQPMCSALIAALPARVMGQQKRAIEPPDVAAAAWGDPPITLRCGVTTPAAYSPGAQLLVVNGVQWLPETLSDGVRFTTIGRTAQVEVTVPAAYSPEADVLTEVGGAVSSQIPPA